MQPLSRTGAFCPTSLPTRYKGGAGTRVLCVSWFERGRADEHSEHNVLTDRGVEPRRFYYVRVRNLHHHKTATNCYVYLEKVVRLGDPPTEMPV
jgi:hypothetical protein